MKSPKPTAERPANGVCNPAAESLAGSLKQAVKEAVRRVGLSDAAAEPLLDSINQAVARLGISRSLLYSEINKGRLRTVKVGKRRLVPRDAQRDWLASLPPA
jgi:excisionase family DNA binding protein